MDVFEAVRLRRSVKPERMRPDPIPKETIERLLEAANWAPSHGLTEPWRFVVFTGDARLELGEALGRGSNGGEPLPEGDPRREKIMTKVRTAPVAIAIVCEPSRAANIVEHEEIASVAMAVQNLHLCARALDLAAFWSSGKKAFSPAVAELLGLVPPQRCLGVLFVGYPAEAWPTSSRGPVSEKVTWRDAATRVPDSAPRSGR